MGCIAHVNSSRAVVTTLLLVEHREAESVENFGDAAVLVAGFSP